MAIESGNASKFGSLSLAVMENAATLAKTFLLDTSAIDFRSERGGTGGTVDVYSSLIPKATKAKAHTAANRAAKDEFVFESLEDTSTPITLSDFIYYGSEINYNEETFLDIALDRDLVRNSGIKVAEYINGLIVNALNVASAAAVPAPVAVTGTIEEKTAAIIAAIVSLRTELNTNKASTLDRTLAVSSDIAGILLQSPQFSNVSVSGTASALEEATLGRKYGFNIVEEADLADGSLVAYTKEAYGLVLRTKAPSYNAIESSVTDANGFVLNVTIDRDGKRGIDLLNVGVFVGFGALDSQKIAFKKLDVSA